MSGALVNTQSFYTGIFDNRKTVVSAGTALQLSATSVACSCIVVQALRSNTGKIAVGGSTVVAAAGTERGAILNPGDSETLYLVDLSLVYIDSTVSGEGVSYQYFR